MPATCSAHAAPRVTIVFALLAAAFASQPAAAQTSTYISLGDSIGFGYLTAGTTPPSFGDQGYVAPYADYLATLPVNGGVRPNVINLAVPGETSSSFFAGGQPGRALNLNYTMPGDTQIGLLRAAIVAEAGAGRSIDTVSLSLGGTDLLALAQIPGFLGLPFEQQFQLVTQALQTLQMNTTDLLTELRAELPDAHILIQGLANPFAALPGHPLFELSTPAVGGLNAVLGVQSAIFDATFVNNFPAFVGREAELTYIILDPPPGSNVNPTPAGYAVIAQQMVPAPAGLALVVLGGAFAGRRRR